MNRRLFVPTLKTVSSNLKKDIGNQLFTETNFFQSVQSIQNRKQSRLYGYFCRNYKYQKLGFTESDYEAFLSRILNTYLNRREVTASTKTKSEVRGGGKKPWNQKGLGRARAGSSRSPLWRGGGVCFGPKPKTVRPKINKREYGLAIRLMLRLAYQQKRLFIVQGLKTDLFQKIVKTRDLENLFQAILDNVQTTRLKSAVRFVLSQQEYRIFGDNLKKSSSNLPKINVICENELSLSTFTKPTNFIFTIDAFLNTKYKFM
jgi:50S ribosomal protein L4